MEEDSSSWVDGIIRDLIHGSNADGDVVVVSIPQLILNVREVIHPCNPPLASLIEHRLRSLTAANGAAIGTINLRDFDRRRSRTQSSELARERKEELKRQETDEQGLNLFTLLLKCAEAVSSDNLEEAHTMLLEISQLATPFGTSAQRIAAYFSEAMSSRIVSSCLGIYAPLPTIPHGHKLAAAFQVFDGISPFVKFSHFTANQAIQEAFEREDSVHIIDLDIMQGLQWPGLLHILASRPGGPPFVRLTGFGKSKEALETTGKRLFDFAQKLGLSFEFCAVAGKAGRKVEEVVERLKLRKGEALAVHWLQHSLYSSTASDDETLSLLQR